MSLKRRPSDVVIKSALVDGREAVSSRYIAQSWSGRYCFCPTAFSDRRKSRGEETFVDAHGCGQDRDEVVTLSWPPLSTERVQHTQVRVGGAVIGADHIPQRVVVRRSAVVDVLHSG